MIAATVEKIKLYLKKTASCSFMFLLVSRKRWNKKPRIQVDKELQWENIKQKLFR